MFDAPHGAVVAACMPAAIAINVKALREREPEHDSLKRYTEVAVMLTGCVQITFLSYLLPRARPPALLRCVQHTGFFDSGIRVSTEVLTSFGAMQLAQGRQRYRRGRRTLARGDERQDECPWPLALVGSNVFSCCWHCIALVFRLC